MSINDFGDQAIWNVLDKIETKEKKIEKGNSWLF